MKILFSKSAALAAVIAMSMTAVGLADTISQWTFDNVVVGGTWPAPAINSPAPSLGAGTVTPLGMDNNYTYANNEGPGSVAWCDVILKSGSDNAWRIRGPSNLAKQGPDLANGWNTAAPQYTQGAAFAASTAGFQNVQVSFDWFSTTQGVRDMQPQYTTDGTTWSNIGGLLTISNQADVNANFESFSLDFSGIPAVNDNPNFAVHLVSAYDPTYTGAGAPTYTASKLTGGLPTVYNNSSGNWRFDNITFSGAPVPEGTQIGRAGQRIRIHGPDLEDAGVDLPVATEGAIRRNAAALEHDASRSADGDRGIGWLGVIRRRTVECRS